MLPSAGSIESIDMATSDIDKATSAINSGPERLMPVFTIEISRKERHHTGRAGLHVMSREELGWPAIPDLLKPFYAFEEHSLLENEPPVHTRLRTLVNRAFLSRQVERLRARIEGLANELIDGFAAEKESDLMAGFA